MVKTLPFHGSNRSSSLRAITKYDSIDMKKRQNPIEKFLNPYPTKHNFTIKVDQNNYLTDVLCNGKTVIDVLPTGFKANVEFDCDRKWFIVDIKCYADNVEIVREEDEKEHLQKQISETTE